MEDSAKAVNNDNIEENASGFVYIGSSNRYTNTTVLSTHANKCASALKVSDKVVNSDTIVDSVSNLAAMVSSHQGETTTVLSTHTSNLHTSVIEVGDKVVSDDNIDKSVSNIADMVSGHQYANTTLPSTHTPNLNTSAIEVGDNAVNDNTTLLRNIINGSKVNISTHAFDAATKNTNIDNSSEFTSNIDMYNAVANTIVMHDVDEVTNVLIASDIDVVANIEELLESEKYVSCMDYCDDQIEIIKGVNNTIELSESSRVTDLPNYRDLDKAVKTPEPFEFIKPTDVHSEKKHSWTLTMDFNKELSTAASNFHKLQTIKTASGTALSTNFNQITNSATQSRPSCSMNPEIQVTCISTSKSLLETLLEQEKPADEYRNAKRLGKRLNMIGRCRYENRNRILPGMSLQLLNSSEKQYSITTESAEANITANSQELPHVEEVIAFADGKFQCLLCTSSYSEIEIIPHFYFYHDEYARRMECCYCGRKFVFQSQLLHHEKMHKQASISELPLPNNIVTESPPKCIDHIHYFKTMQLYRTQSNLSDFDPSQPIFCEICGKLMAISQNQKIEERRKPYQCRLCFLRFPSLLHLKRHEVKKHESYSKYICNNCGKKYKSRNTFKNHVQTTAHSQNKSFSCNNCKKRFNTLLSLNAHKLCNACK